MGDSLTAACWLTPACWVNVYTADLNADLHVDTSTTNLGIYGATSAQILDLVEHDAGVRAAIAGADVVTYDGGINEFLSARAAYINGACGGVDDQDCLRAMVSAFDSNWDRLVSEIRALAPGAMRRTMNTYYSVVAFDEAHGYYGVLNSYLSQMNAHVSSDPGGSVADVHLAYNGPSGADDPVTKGYILPDSVHPTDVGHSVIADVFRGVGYAELDADRDSVFDALDNCPNLYNPDQKNSRPDFTDLHIYGKLFDDTTALNSTTLGDACDPDIDGDGLANGTEAALDPSGASHAQCPGATANTDPLKLDTDGDGFTDRAECLLGTDPASAASKPPTTYATGDTDHDMLPDALEATLGTDPTKVDSDGDKLNDGVEFLYYGSDPTNPNTDADICTDGKEAASLNNDNKVNSTDQLIVAKSFSAIGAPYVRDFDVNKDGKINSTDMLIQTKVLDGVGAPAC